MQPGVHIKNRGYSFLRGQKGKDTQLHARVSVIHDLEQSEAPCEPKILFKIVSIVLVQVTFQCTGVILKKKK